MGSRRNVHVKDTGTATVASATAVLLLTAVFFLVNACSSGIQPEPATGTGMHTARPDNPATAAAMPDTTGMTTTEQANNSSSPLENQISENVSVDNNTDTTGDASVDVTVSEPVACTASDTVMQARMLSLINAARAQARNCGNEPFAATSPLTWNSTLLIAAKAHSIDMTSHNFFSHTGSDGSDISARVSATEYNWDRVGENIAAGQRSVAETVNGWLESEGHCSNLMNADFEEVAVACVEDRKADYGRYWTNVLGRRF
ncbi:MAG: CAP domain-containing protein [Granulosicoccus sp.]